MNTINLAASTALAQQWPNTLGLGPSFTLGNPTSKTVVGVTLYEGTGYFATSTSSWLYSAPSPYTTFTAVSGYTYGAYPQCMVVLNGILYIIYQNTDFVSYNIGSQTWTTLSSATIPAPSTSNFMVLDSNHLATYYGSDIAVYNISGNSWTTTANPSGYTIGGAGTSGDGVVWALLTSGTTPEGVWTYSIANGWSASAVWPLTELTTGWTSATMVVSPLTVSAIFAVSSTAFYTAVYDRLSGTDLSAQDAGGLPFGFEDLPVLVMDPSLSYAPSYISSGNNPWAVMWPCNTPLWSETLALVAASAVL